MRDGFQKGGGRRGTAADPNCGRQNGSPVISVKRRAVGDGSGHRTGPGTRSCAQGRRTGVLTRTDLCAELDPIGTKSKTTFEGGGITASFKYATGELTSMKKRILACLLMLCMMVTMLPTTAFATEEVQNLEFSQAAGEEAEGTDTAATPSTTGKLAEVYWSDGDGSDKMTEPLPSKPLRRLNEPRNCLRRMERSISVRASKLRESRHGALRDMATPRSCAMPAIVGLSP